MRLLRFLIRFSLLLLHVSIGLVIAALLFHRSNREYHHHRGIIRRWMRLSSGIMGCRIHYSQDPDISTASPHANLFVANHISWLDIFVLGGVFELRFLSKHEVRGWPLFGWLSAASGTLFIQRGSGSEAAVDAIRKALVSGDHVLIFAESTTSDGTGVKPFHPRLFKAAIESERPIRPVMIRYQRRGRPFTELAWTDDSNLLLTFWHVLSAAHTDVFVHAFAPLATQAEASRTQLAKTCHSQIRNRLENP